MNRSKRVLTGLSVACASDAVVMGFGVRNSCDYDTLVMPVYPMRGGEGKLAPKLQNPLSRS